MRPEQWLHTLPLRLRSLLRRKAVDAELDEELQFHLESHAARYRAAGLSAEDASRAARRAIGGLTQVREECRDMRKLNLFDNLMQDVRYATRNFSRSPLFTASAVLSLALGIGANTAIFSLIHTVMLKKLPVPHPDELAVLIPVSREGRSGSGFSYPAFLDFRSANATISGLMAASGIRPAEIGWNARTETVPSKMVSDNYFSLLGVQPVRGRLFTAGDDTRQVAVISAGYWKRAFEEGNAVVGKEITLEGLPYTIVGVAPPDFLGESVGEAPDVWSSIALETAQRRHERGFVWLNLMARLRPGRTPPQAMAELNAVLAQAPEAAARIAVEPGARGFSKLRERFTASLRLLMAIVVVVLLIACANLASLLLARAAARRREIATRIALGAGRIRVIRQLLTESLLLSAIGGALGLVFASWSVKLLASSIVPPRNAEALAFHPDLRILLFTGAVSLLTGVLFGLVPALQAVGRDLAPALKLSARVLGGQERRGAWSDGLMILQIALSLLLLVAGGLFARTLHNLKSQDIGFRRDSVLILQVATERSYRPEWSGLTVRLLERVRAIPGVETASVSFNGTLTEAGSGVGGLQIEGYIPQTQEDRRARADWVGPEYFSTAGVGLAEGREFLPADNQASQKVAIINQAAARHYFSDRPAVGRRFEFNKESYEIIGIARDAKYVELRQPAPRVIYFAALQAKSGFHSLEVRTAGSPTALAGAVQAAVRELDPRLRLGEVWTIQDRIDRKLSRERLVADLSGFFAGLTLLLVSIGIYGTLAYRVAQKTNEIGIRMALGASASAVVLLTLRRVFLCVAAGSVAGVAAVLACGPALTSMLFGLKPTDMATIGVAVAVILSVAMAAACLPARRAARIDPLAALRVE